MTYTGEFLNINNILYRVTITTQTAGNPQTITMGETPVMLSQNGGELFQNIKPQSATIQILTTEDLSDLYTVCDMSNTVVVEDVTNGITIFDGYITPNQYSQPYLWKNSVEIEAVDILSALIQKKYEVPTVGALRDSLRDVLLRYMNGKTILCDGAVYDFVLWQFKCDACLDKTVFEVITECLKTAGLTITSKNNTYYIFDNEITINGQTVTWVNIDTEATTTETNNPVNLVLDNYCSEDQNIEIDQTFNEITATPEIEKYDKEIIEGEEIFPTEYTGVTPPFPYSDYGLNSNSDYSEHYTACKIYKLDNTQYYSQPYRIIGVQLSNNDIADVLLQATNDMAEDNGILSDYIDLLTTSTPTDYNISTDYYYSDLNTTIVEPTLRNPHACTFDNSVKELANIGTLSYTQFYGNDYPFTTINHQPAKLDEESELIFYTGALQTCAWINNVLGYNEHRPNDTVIIDKVYKNPSFPSFGIKTGTYNDYAVTAGKKGYITLSMDIFHSFGDGRGQQVYSNHRTITNYPKTQTDEKFFGKDSEQYICETYTYPSQDYNSGVCAAWYVLRIGDKVYNSNRQWVTYDEAEKANYMRPLYYYNNLSQDGTQAQEIKINAWMQLVNNIQVFNNCIEAGSGEAIIAVIDENDSLQGEMSVEIWLQPLRPRDTYGIVVTGFPWWRYIWNGWQIWQMPNVAKYIKVKKPTVKYQITDSVTTWETLQRVEGDEDSDNEITYTITNTDDYDRPNEDLEFMLCSYREEIPFAKSYIIDPNNGLQITTIEDPYDQQTKRPEERVIQQYNRHYQSAKYIYNVGVHGYFMPYSKVTATATGNRQYVADVQQYDIMHDTNTAKLIEV